MKTQIFLLLAVGVLGVASVASAGIISGASLPVSSCANDISDSGFTCNFFETTASGTASDTSNIVLFPSNQSVSSGYVVLLDSPGASMTDPTQWSDVLNFIDNGTGQSTSAQLLSSGCNCFPTSAVVNAAGHIFLVETQTGSGNDFTDSTPFVTGFNTFNIFSAAPVSASTAVPEPASLAQMGSALILLFGFVRIRSKVA